MALCGSNTAHYHVWFQPKGQLLRRLQTEIRRLSEQYGSPSWEPHVTFVPRFEAKDNKDAQEKAEAIAGKLKKFKIRYSEPADGPEGERTVALSCQRDGELNKAISTATQVLGVRSFDSPPVITLFLAPESVSEETRRKVLEEEKDRLFGSADSIERYFEADVLSLWGADPTDQSPPTWKKLAELPLQS